MATRTKKGLEENRRPVEEDLPIRYMGGHIFPDDDKLLEMTTAQERAYLLLDLTEGFVDRSQRRKKLKPTVSRISSDFAVQTQERVFPVLLSPALHVELHPSALRSEMELLLELGDPEGLVGPRVYSLRVLEPRQYQRDLRVEGLPYVRQLELNSGYLYHEILYGRDSKERFGLLKEFLHDVERLEVVIDTAEMQRLCKTVSIHT